MKSVYKIPYDLNKTQLDRQFQFQRDGVRFTKRPVTLASIIVWVCGFFIWLTLVMKGFVAGSIVGLVLFTIGWVGVVYMAGSLDEAQRYRVRLFLPYLRFLDKTKRNVSLYRSDPLTRLQREMGVRSIVNLGRREGALITMVDGSFAKMYLVVGAVSALMFDEERAFITDAYASFFKTAEENVDFIFDTIPSSQSVEEQLLTLEQRRSFQPVPELQALYDEDEHFLKYKVGGHVDGALSYSERAAAKAQGFRSSAQSMMIVAPTREGLNRAEEAAYLEYRQTGRMFKYIRPLTYTEVEAYYRTFLGA